MNKYKKGFSLLEILLVLAIAAAIIISAFVIYPKIRSHNNIMNEIRNIGTAVAGTKQLYAGKANYEGLNAVLLINAGVLPESLLVQGAWVRNSWNGLMSFSNGNGYAGNNSTIQIQNSGVAASDCYLLGVQIYNTYKEMLDQMMINNRVVYIRKINGNGNDFTLDAVQAGCAVDTQKADFYMTFF